MACGHAHTVDAAGKPGDKTDKKSDDQAEKRDDAGPAGHDTPPHDDKAQKADRKVDKKDVAATASVPVATGPDALLAPGAEDQIRKKLVDAGFMHGDDDAVGPGLRKFQEKHDLPATGQPDHATVAKLGLDPRKVFKHAESP